MQRLLLTLSIISLVFLSACGDTSMNRSLSGAAIGAGIGTMGSVIAGGAVVPGLLIGGAVGAATGVLTDTSQINLGKPIWEK